MKQGKMTVAVNRQIAPSMMEMLLSGDATAIRAPGQFINLLVEGKFLRRPISVCDYDDKSVKILYKVVGGGTKWLSEQLPGKEIDVLTGLGNGFDTAKSGGEPLLIGGGAGVPPMYALAKKLLAEKKRVTVILGFNTKAEVYYRENFLSLGARVFVTTADGSDGIRGFVTDAMKEVSYSYFYTCGPMPMFLAIEKIAKTSGQYSFEERMGCGFGACMGCSCETKYGSKRICRDGPVLEREEIVW